MFSEQKSPHSYGKWMENKTKACGEMLKTKQWEFKFVYATKSLRANISLSLKNEAFAYLFLDNHWLNHGISAF